MIHNLYFLCTLRYIMHVLRMQFCSCFNISYHYSVRSKNRSHGNSLPSSNLVLDLEQFETEIQIAGLIFKVHAASNVMK